MNRKRRAMKLEMLFRKFGETINVSADEFMLDFKDAMEMCLSNLVAQGIIQNEEVSSFVAEYDSIDSENIEELMSQLNELYKKKIGE